MSWSMTTLLAAWAGVASPADLVAVATAVLAAVAVVLAARLVAAGGTAVPASVRAVPARARAARGQSIRSADPDAAGRPRPRAPGR